MALIPQEGITEALRSLGGWKYDAGRKALQKEFKFRDFKEAMQFVNRVAEVAEESNHHPDIDIRYNTVSIATWSHDAGGVTSRDVKLAERIKQIKI